MENIDGIFGRFEIDVREATIQDLGYLEDIFQDRFVHGMKPDHWLYKHGVRNGDMLWRFTHVKNWYKPGETVRVRSFGKHPKEAKRKRQILFDDAKRESKDGKGCIKQMMFHRLKKVVFRGAISQPVTLFNKCGPFTGYDRRHFDNSVITKLEKENSEDPLFTRLMEYEVIGEKVGKNKFGLVRFQADDGRAVETDKHNDKKWNKPEVFGCKHEMIMWFKCDAKPDIQDQLSGADIAKPTASTGSKSRRRLTALADRFQDVRDYQSGNQSPTV